jgi:nitroreductase
MDLYGAIEKRRTIRIFESGASEERLKRDLPLLGEGKKDAEKALGLPEGYELTAILKIGEAGEEGYPREKNRYAERRPEFSWLHLDKFHEAGT